MNQSTTKIRPPAAALRLLVAVVLAIGLTPLPAFTGQALAAGELTIGAAAEDSGGSPLVAFKDATYSEGKATLPLTVDFTKTTEENAYLLNFKIAFSQNNEALSWDKAHIDETGYPNNGKTNATREVYLLGDENHSFASTEPHEYDKYCYLKGRLNQATQIYLLIYPENAESPVQLDLPIAIADSVEGDVAVSVSTASFEVYHVSDTGYEWKRTIGDCTVSSAVLSPSYSAAVAGGVENGTVSLSAPEGKELTGLSKGNTVAVTATPAEGYELESLYYVADGSETQVAIEGGSFVMPAANVTVHATFKKTAAQEEAEKAAAKEAADKIDALGDSPSEDDVEAALAAFDGLSDDEKAHVPAATVAKLLGAQQKVAAAKLEKAKADAAAAEESRVKAVSDAVAAQAKAAELQKQVEAAQAAQKAAESKAAEAEKARKAAEAKAAEAEKKAAAAAQPAAKKANTMTAKGKTVTVKASKAKKKAQTLKAAKAFTVKGAQGKVTYKVAKWGKNAKKYLKVASNGKVTVKKGAKKGTYTVKVKVTAAGNAGYKAASKTVTLKVKVA